jgi:predicted transport protein
MATPDEMLQTMIANLPEKTGKSLEEWLAITTAQGFSKHGVCLKWLKTEHGVSHGFANLITSKTLEEMANKSGNGEPIDPLQAQYSGPKAALKPIYDKLITHVSNFGSDVEISVKKTYVSLRRNKQFALIQASTKTRVDVGIQLSDAPASDRLELSGSFNAMVSHRVRLESVDDVDCELIDLLEIAYDRN